MEQEQEVEFGTLEPEMGPGMAGTGTGH